MAAMRAWLMSPAILSAAPRTRKLGTIDVKLVAATAVTIPIRLTAVSTSISVRPASRERRCWLARILPMPPLRNEQDLLPGAFQASRSEPRRVTSVDGAHAHACERTEGDDVTGMSAVVPGVMGFGA